MTTPTTNNLVISCHGLHDAQSGMGSAAYVFNSNLGYDVLLYHEVGGSKPRAELIALYYAIAIATQHNPGRVQIFIDSTYVVNTINIYYPRWLHEGFQTKRGKEVKHLDLIQPIYEAIAQSNGTITVSYYPGDITMTQWASYALTLPVGQIVYDKTQ